MPKDNVLKFERRPRDVQSEVTARWIAAPLLVGWWWHNAICSWWAAALAEVGSDG